MHAVTQRQAMEIDVQLHGKLVLLAVVAWFAVKYTGVVIDGLHAQNS